MTVIGIGCASLSWLQMAVNVVFPGWDLVLLVHLQAGVDADWP